uniref:Inhibitor of trypsin and hageman factor-like n=1 Tax=Nicotiana sylvestris TaxID=4096 RepID=A0A1U7X6R6_NICSY|nr:PREDICTED: inhibitor of trypsin and hageman factor-like [Nicotiana sylvestris]
MESKNCDCSPPYEVQRNEKYCSISPAHCPKTWPELVGFSGDEAAKVILAEMPNLLIEFIHPPWALTQDFRPSRVRIIVDRFDKVSMSPSIG